MTGKRRALFLCQNLPYPPDGGALIRSYHTLRILSTRFDVTSLCFYRSATRGTEAAIRRGREGLVEFGPVHTFPIPQETSRVRLVTDHLRSVASGRAYTRWAYESPAFRSRLGDLLESGAFDFAHVDSLDLVTYLPLLTERIPVALAHHNVESQLLASRSAAEQGWRRLYLAQQARLTQGEEERWCGRVSVNFVVSPEDREALRTIAPDGRYVVMPNGVDTDEFTPRSDTTDREIVFVGGHTWFPNRDGMEFFAREVLPRIRDREPDVRVVWVGRASEEVRREYAQQGVEMTGYVEDIRPFVGRATCFVAPLRVGGGTRLKILDAWAMGKAVVSTSQGCAGLPAENGDNCLIADDPEAFAHAVIDLLRNPSLRRSIGARARQVAVERFDWDVIGAEFLSHLDDLPRPETLPA